MMVHGMSHAAASLVCTVTAGIMAQVLSAKVPYVAETLLKHLLPALKQVGWQAQPWQVLELISIVVLGFAWGIAFKFAHR